MRRCRRVAARMSPLMTAHYDAIMMNDALFAKVREVYDARLSAGLTPEQLRLTEKTYDGFVRAGALLSAEQKQRLKQINSRLSELSVTFAENLLAENNAYTLEVAVDSLVGASADGAGCGSGCGRGPRPQGTLYLHSRQAEHDPLPYLCEEPRAAARDIRGLPYAVQPRRRTRQQGRGVGDGAPAQREGPVFWATTAMRPMSRRTRWRL